MTGELAEALRVRFGIRCFGIRHHADGCEPDPLCVWYLAELLRQYMSERKALRLAEIIDRAYRGRSNA